MPDRKAGTTEEGSAETPTNPRASRLEPAGEAVVNYQDTPLRPEADKRIHSRRPLPLVPETPNKEKGEDC
jgi:hypothetical protein